MKTSTECPKCGGKISLFNLLKQFTLPTHIKCNHCKIRLRAEFRWMRFFMVVEILMYAVIAALILYGALMSRSDFEQKAPWIIVGIAGYLVFEVVAAVLYLNYARFSPREQHKD